MIASRCERITSRYGDKISEIVSEQRENMNEAIFFIYEDGSTSQVFTGERTNISLSKEEEQQVFANGRIVTSIHTHPQVFDPSTIDLITGTLSNQQTMCIAVPGEDFNVDDDFILSCYDLSGLSQLGRQRLARAMRRSSLGITEVGRQLRKQTALSRFNIPVCRTHEIKKEGLEFPILNRPSVMSAEIPTSGVKVKKKE